MLLFNALQQLASLPGHFARRPAGVVLQSTDRMKLVTFRTGREYRWTPKFRDLVADDWEVVSLERFAQELQAMQDRASQAASAEAESNGD